MPIPTIKAIGFDLDQTLYPDSPEIQEVARGEIYRFISETLQLSPKEAKEQFEQAYERFGGGGSALESLGIEHGSERIRDCITRADLSQIIRYDPKLVQMLKRMKKDFYIFMITESREEDAYKKLQALGIPLGIFHFTACWDTFPLRKHTGTIFPYLFRESGFRPEEHLYCGDKLNDDILPAKKAGIKTVLVGKEVLAGKECPEADYRIAAIHELEALLYGS